MFGTWHPTSRERSLTLRSPSASCSRTHSRFGSASARAMLAAWTRVASLVVTIASIADMNDMIFQGRVDESEVGKVKEGMPVTISVGALGEQSFRGKLEYISPKGVEKEGTIEFEVKAAVELKQGVFMRANYSANADIILDRRDKVLAIDESLLKFEKGKAFVEVETLPQQFEKREVSLGLSDGVHVEVLSGITKDARIKKPESGGGEPKK